MRQFVIAMLAASAFAGSGSVTVKDGDNEVMKVNGSIGAVVEGEGASMKLATVAMGKVEMLGDYVIDDEKLVPYTFICA